MPNHRKSRHEVKGKVLTLREVSPTLEERQRYQDIREQTNPHITSGFQTDEQSLEYDHYKEAGSWASRKQRDYDNKFHHDSTYSAPYQSGSYSTATATYQPTGYSTYTTPSQSDSYSTSTVAYQPSSYSTYATPSQSTYYPQSTATYRPKDDAWRMETIGRPGYRDLRSPAYHAAEAHDQ